MKNLLILALSLLIYSQSDKTAIERWAKIHLPYCQKIEKSATSGPFSSFLPGTYYRLTGQTECYAEKEVWFRFFDGVQIKESR